MSSAVSVFLILALLFPSIAYAADAGETDGTGDVGGGVGYEEGNGNNYGGDGSLGGGDPGNESQQGLGDGPEGAASGDDDGDGHTNEAEAAAGMQANNDAVAANGYGMQGEVNRDATAQGRLDGTIDADQVVMSDGSLQSLSKGKEAHEAINGPTVVGGSVNVAATHEAYQDGRAKNGQVVGIYTGRDPVSATEASQAAIEAGIAGNVGVTASNNTERGFFDRVADWFSANQAPATDEVAEGIQNIVEREVAARQAPAMNLANALNPNLAWNAQLSTNPANQQRAFDPTPISNQGAANVTQRGTAGDMAAEAAYAVAQPETAGVFSTFSRDNKEVTVTVMSDGSVTGRATTRDPGGFQHTHSLSEAEISEALGHVPTALDPIGNRNLSAINPSNIIGVDLGATQIGLAPALTKEQIDNLSIFSPRNTPQQGVVIDKQTMTGTTITASPAGGVFASKHTSDELDRIAEINKTNPAAAGQLVDAYETAKNAQFKSAHITNANDKAAAVALNERTMEVVRNAITEFEPKDAIGVGGRGYLTGAEGEIAIDGPFNAAIDRAQEAAKAATEFADNAVQAASLQEQKNDVANKFGAEARTLDAEIQAANLAKGAAQADAIAALSQSREAAVRANTLEAMADIASKHAQTARNELNNALSVTGLEAQTRALDDAAIAIAQNAAVTVEALREAAVRGNLGLRDSSAQISAQGNLTSSRQAVEAQLAKQGVDTFAVPNWDDSVLTTDAIRNQMIDDRISLGMTPEQAVRSVQREADFLNFVAGWVPSLMNAFDYRTASKDERYSEEVRDALSNLADASAKAAAVELGLEVTAGIALGVLSNNMAPMGIGNLGREIDKAANDLVGQFTELPDYPAYNPNVGAQMSEFTVDVKSNYNPQTGEFGAPEVSIQSIAANDNVPSPAVGAAAARDLGVAANDVSSALAAATDAANKSGVGTIEAFQQALNDVGAKVGDAVNQNPSNLTSPQVQSYFSDINNAIDVAKDKAANPVDGKVDPELGRALDNLENEIGDFAEQSARVAALNESPALGAAAARDTTNVTSLEAAVDVASRDAYNARMASDAVDPQLQRALDQVETARREFQDIADNPPADATNPAFVQALQEMDNELGRVFESNRAALEAAQRVEDQIAVVNSAIDDVKRAADQDVFDAAVRQMEQDLARAVDEQLRMSEITQTLNDSVTQLNRTLSDMQRAASEDATAKETLDSIEPNITKAIDETAAASLSLKNTSQAVTVAKTSTDRVVAEANTRAIASRQTSNTSTGGTRSIASRAINTVVAASIFAGTPIGPTVRAITNIFDVPNPIARIADEAIDIAGSRTSRTNASLFGTGQRVPSVKDTESTGRMLAGEVDEAILGKFRNEFNRNGQNIVAALQTLTPPERQAIAAEINVAVNRLDPTNPARDTLDEVYKAPAQFSTFSNRDIVKEGVKTTLNKYDTAKYNANKAAYDAAARAYLDGTVASEFGTKDAVPVPNATHYHANYVNPSWARNLKEVGRVGDHVYLTVEGTNQSIEGIDLAMNQTHLAAGSVNIAEAIPEPRPANESTAATGYTPGFIENLLDRLSTIDEAQGAVVQDAAVRQNDLGYIADTDFVLPMNGAVGGLLDAKGEPLGGTPNYGTVERGRWHLGIDIYGLTPYRLTGPSNPVLAFADAEITNVTRAGNYGWIIEMTAINAKINGVPAKARYAHLANPAKYGIEKGMKVSKGQVLSHVTGSGTDFERAAAKHFFNDESAVGRLTDEQIMQYEDLRNKDGWAQGMAKPHLHFEVRTAQGYMDRGVNTVNPRAIFPAFVPNQPFYAGASPDNKLGGLDRIEATPLDNIVEKEQVAAVEKPVPRYEDLIAKQGAVNDAKLKGANDLVAGIQEDLKKASPAPKTLTEKVTSGVNKGLENGVGWVAEKWNDGVAYVNGLLNSVNEAASRQPAPETSVQTTGVAEQINQLQERINTRQAEIEKVMAERNVTRQDSLETLQKAIGPELANEFFTLTQTRGVLDLAKEKVSTDSAGAAAYVEAAKKDLDSFNDDSVASSKVPSVVEKVPEQTTVRTDTNIKVGKDANITLLAPFSDLTASKMRTLGKAFVDSGYQSTNYVGFLEEFNLASKAHGIKANYDKTGAQQVLAGHSFGAIAAIELANQLVALGVPAEKIVLILIDPGQGSFFGLEVPELPTSKLTSGAVGIPEGVEGKLYIPSHGSRYTQLFPNGIKGLSQEDTIKIEYSALNDLVPNKALSAAHIGIGSNPQTITHILSDFNSPRTQEQIASKVNEQKVESAGQTQISVDPVSFSALLNTLKNTDVKIGPDGITYAGKSGSSHPYEFVLSDKDGTYPNQIKGEFTITTKEVNGIVTEFTLTPINPNGTLTVGLGQKLNSTNPEDFNTISGNMTITGKITNGEIGSLTLTPINDQLTLKGKAPLVGQIVRNTEEPIVFNADKTITASLGDDVEKALGWYSERTPELVGKLANELSLINKYARANGTVPENIAALTSKEQVAAVPEPKVEVPTTQDGVNNSLESLRGEIGARVGVIQNELAKPDVTIDSLNTLTNELTKIKEASSLLVDAKDKTDAGDLSGAQGLIDQARAIFETRNNTGSLIGQLDNLDLTLLGGIGLGIAALLSKLISTLRTGGSLNPFARFSSVRKAATVSTEGNSSGGALQAGGTRVTAANDNAPTVRNSYGKTLGSKIENGAITIGIIAAILLLIKKSLFDNDQGVEDEQSGQIGGQDSGEVEADDSGGKKSLWDRIKDFFKRGGGGLPKQDNSNATTTAATKGVVTVKVARDLNSNQFDLQVTDVYAPEEYIEELETSEAEETEYAEDDEEPSIIFNEYNEVVYSDGTFAPVTEDGVVVDESGWEYIYVVEYYDDGEPVTIEANDERVPENFFTNVASFFFNDNDPFTIDDVAYITRAFYDPKPDVPRDELYEYTIILNDSSARKVVVPEYTSYAFLSFKFAEVGFEGDVLALVAVAENIAKIESPSLLSQTVEAITGGFASMKELLGLGTETEGESSTDLATLTPTNDGVVNINDIRKATVFFGIEAECPDTEGLNQPYLYEVVIAKEALPDAYSDVSFRALRCGAGDKLTYVNEVASHLESLAGFGTIDREALYEMLRFGDLSNLVFEEDAAPVIAEEPASEEEATEEEKPTLPNTTNEVSFDVKAVNNNGVVLTDWVYGDLEISSGVQLFFRWNGEKYAQCLPFLNDNGLYALTRGDDPSLTSGNTETEGYNVREGSLTYRIECGGQENGETGVDIREINVTVGN